MRTELEMALLKPRDPVETRTAFESLRGQVERLITLSNALLYLEELRASGTATAEPVDIAALVAEVTARYLTATAADGRAIEVQVAPRLHVEGNAHWLDLALDNLVSNAVRYGAGTITVAAHHEADRTQIMVSDEGPGFPRRLRGQGVRQALPCREQPQQRRHRAGAGPGQGRRRGPRRHRHGAGFRGKHLPRDTHHRAGLGADLIGRDGFRRGTASRNFGPVRCVTLWRCCTCGSPPRTT